jgi:hypothetical protein
VAERVWTVEEANAALERVGGVVARARADLAAARRQQRELVRRTPTNGHGAAPPDLDEVRRAVTELAAEGIVLRDLDQGLVDFDAVTPEGDHYWLCWVVGEPELAWWHWPEDGFAGRTPLTEPPVR